MNVLERHRTNKRGLEFDADLCFLSPLYAATLSKFIIENELEFFGNTECTRNL